jgi:hypothetical protein
VCSSDLWYDQLLNSINCYDTENSEKILAALMEERGYPSYLIQGHINGTIPEAVMRVVFAKSATRKKIKSFSGPNMLEEAAVIMTGLGVERIMQGLAILESQPRDDERLIRQVYDYSMPNVSDKIVRIIHSYTDYVNRVVWKKY